jgi:endonuclease-3 related protein
MSLLSDFMSNIENNVNLIYEKLLETYSYQGWWPFINYDGINPTKSGAINGYHPGDYDFPKNNQQKFEVIFGSILTQNTAWPSVEQALNNLNELTEFTPESLLEFSQNNEEEFKDAIRCAGFVNQKANYLKNISEFYIKINHKDNDKIENNKEEYFKEEDNKEKNNKKINNKKINNKKYNYKKEYFKEEDNKKENNKNYKEKEKFNNIPSRKDLLAVKGIGHETADSILLFAHKQKEFKVDAYTKRIFSYLGHINEKDTYLSVKSFFETNFDGDVNQYQEYHALLVEHAKRYYSKKPYGVNDKILNEFIIKK